LTNQEVLLIFQPIKPPDGAKTMVIIHPTVTHDRASLAALQIATGMRVALGQCYLRLINADGTAPACKPAPRKPITYRRNWGGGDDAA